MIGYEKKERHPTLSQEKDWEGGDADFVGGENADHGKHD